MGIADTIRDNALADLDLPVEIVTGPCPVLQPSAHDGRLARKAKAIDLVIEIINRDGVAAIFSNWEWKIGTRVRKKSGSAWQGRVVGYYSTALTPEGYAVESEREPGSVQIYPRAALEFAADDESDETRL